MPRRTIPQGLVWGSVGWTGLGFDSEGPGQGHPGKSSPLPAVGRMGWRGLDGRAALAAVREGMEDRVGAVERTG